jgi:glycosyltransferase involved in cell wall biosynthesis/2-polyprenyl-3-methyl-5-hydroxy-6-metoxy-1,4-benzoquinol methylase
MTKFNFYAEPIRLRELPQLPLDVRLATPEQNFGSRGAAREINALYEDVLHNHVIWQPDVYAESRAVAEQFGIKHIIDVGCGNGEKLVHYFPVEEFQTVGLDFHGSLILSNNTYPDRKWVECDLNSYRDLTSVFNEMNTDVPVLLILSDVIEHVPDPRLLLSQLRTVLLRNTANRLVLSTPDRAMLDYKSYGSYPENRAHVREWTHDELVSLCQAAGFQIERSGHTRANQFDEKYCTIYVQLYCEPSQYLDFLRVTGLLYSATLPSHLLLTSEYAGLCSTGGIGTFVAEQRLAYGVDNTICLFIGQQHDLDSELFQRLQLIQPQVLVDDFDLALPAEDIALKATLQLLFYFPNIGKIEYADYQGLGCRLAQAKRASLLPPTVQVIVHCHGATHYLENANQVWYGVSHFKAAEREKISIESADNIVFPTLFLRDLYRESGIDIAEEKVVQLRYPYHFEPVEIEQTVKADTIVFFGKRSAMKGYSLFLAALTTDEGQLHKLGIKRIVFIGPKVTDTQEDVARLSMLRSQFEVLEFTSLGRSDAMDQLRCYANNAFCVMPYLGDNHPYALLDVTFVGVLPLMLRAGGVAELFAEPFDRILLADPSETSLLAGMRSLVKLSVEERHRLRVNFLANMIATQTAINDAVLGFGITTPQVLIPDHVGKATVIVPVFNTDLSFISDLVFGLNNQSLPPVEVIFINDASLPGYARDLEELLQRELHLTYRIISHSVNKGLAGARNTGLNAANTEYVINVDSDDVPLNDFVRDIVHRMDVEQRCAAAVPYLKAFDEETDFNKQMFGGYVYRPLGDGVIASQLDNNLGHANSGYRTSVLREIGGWDESEKSMWEDWALFLKLVSAGHRIGIIPQVACLYRVRKQSMLRTYKVWPAMRRLARNTSGLSRFESFRLQAVMRHGREEENALRSELLQLRPELIGLRAQVLIMQSELTRICAEHAVLTEELNRASVRASRNIVARLTRFPRMFRVVRAIGAAIYKLARRTRNLTVSK